MYISRHPVDHEHIAASFYEDRERLAQRVQLAQTRSSVLSTLSSIAATRYKAGSVVAPDSTETANAMQLAAQANTAILVFSRIETPPRYCRLGDGPPITYSEPVDESHAHVGRWLDAFEQATITRQPDLLETLQGIPNEVLQGSSTSGAEATYLWLNLLRALGSTRPIAQHPSFKAYEAYCANCQDRSAHCKAIRHLSVPFLDVLRQLDCGDNVGLDRALTEAIEMHKKFWSSTEKLRKDFNGFVSLQLTMLAVIAWDRGMRFDVESDYIPTSWVRGKLFESEAGAGSRF